MALSTRRCDSRSRATPRAMTRPTAKETRASGIVPTMPPSRIGQKEETKSCQSMGFCSTHPRSPARYRGARTQWLLRDVDAEVLLADRGESSIGGELGERGVDVG